MTAPLLAVAAHRAIDRQQALITLLQDDPGLRFQLTAPGKREHALAFLEACRRVFMAERKVNEDDQPRVDSLRLFEATGSTAATNEVNRAEI